MKILLTGSTGFVGRWIKQQLSPFHDIVETGRNPNLQSEIIQCDLSHRDEVLRLAEKITPDAIIHAAGNKNIRGCEQNPQAAAEANTQSTENLLTVFGKRLIYISTDFVFEGKTGAYTERDTPHPLTVYGQTKLASEQFGLNSSGLFQVMRLSALYTPDSPFVTTLHDALVNQKPIECFTDTHFSPTYIGEFIDVLKATLDDSSLHLRTIHACGAPQSRYDFAVSYAQAYGFDTQLVIPNKVPNANRLIFPEDISLDNKVTRQHYGIAARTPAECLTDMRTQWNM
ncbi:MAG: hypothetical protein RIR18_1683 [Pseudomonadota bacterium]|jgi:dTDP-4-dehydrorhamnose reductase